MRSGQNFGMSRNVVIKNMAEVLAARAARPDVMKPQLVNGKWRKAKMSALAIARLRKKYLQAGKEWKWDIPKKIVEKKVPFKGKLRDLRRQEREIEIQRCMARMPKLVEGYRTRERERRRQRKISKLTGLAKLLVEPRENPNIITR